MNAATRDPLFEQAGVEVPDPFGPLKALLASRPTLAEDRTQVAAAAAQVGVKLAPKVSLSNAGRSSYLPLLDEARAVRSRALDCARRGPFGRPRALCLAGGLLAFYGDAARMQVCRMRELDPATWVPHAAEVDRLLERAGLPADVQADAIGRNQGETR